MLSSDLIGQWPPLLVPPSNHLTHGTPLLYYVLWICHNEHCPWNASCFAAINIRDLILIVAREESGSGASGGLKVVGVTNFRDPQGVRISLFAIHETRYS